MKVVLPDSTELELPDGATGLDAARAIGPARRAGGVVRSNGAVHDLRVPLQDGQPIRIPDDAGHSDPDALSVLRHSAAHLLAEAVRRLYPGVKIAIGPPVENGFYYDFEFQADSRGRPRADRGGDPARAGRRTCGSGRRSAPPTRDSASSRRTSPTRSSSWKRRTARSRCTRKGTSPTSAAARTTSRTRSRSRRSSSRRSQAPTGAATSLLQLTPDLRHRLLLAGRPRRPPRAARAGARTRPPAPRPPARPLLPDERLARLAVLARRG